MKTANPDDLEYSFAYVQVGFKRTILDPTLVGVQEDFVVLITENDPDEKFGPRIRVGRAPKKASGAPCWLFNANENKYHSSVVVTISKIPKIFDLCNCNIPTTILEQCIAWIRLNRKQLLRFWMNGDKMDSSKFLDSLVPLNEVI